MLLRTMTATTWSEADVRALLAREDFSYQNIKLPYGLSTGGRDRYDSAEKMLPADLTGKTVLDVGCKYGFFCFEALKRGARRVVGIDLDEDSLRKARLLADCLGADVTFKHGNVETDELGETFDYVLCLNLLHHLHNPISALDKLIAHTRERLVLEVATFGAHDAKKFGRLGKLSWLVRPLPLLPALYRNTPVIFLGAGGKKPMVQQFFLSPSAVSSLLLDQRGNFARVDIKEAQHKGRFIAVADKWQIDRMVMVAGPTSVGKSTFIEQLSRAEWLDVAAALEIGQLKDWTVSSPLELHSLHEPVVDRMIYHYDFLRPFLRGPNDHHRDHALDLLESVANLVTVTLWQAPERLAAQHQSATIDRKTKGGRYRGNKRQLKLAEIYREPAQVRALYENWFNYISGFPGQHYVLEIGATPKLHKLADWHGGKSAA